MLLPAGYISGVKSPAKCRNFLNPTSQQCTVCVHCCGSCIVYSLCTLLLVLYCVQSVSTAVGPVLCTVCVHCCGSCIVYSLCPLLWVLYCVQSVPTAVGPVVCTVCVHWCGSCIVYSLCPLLWVLYCVQSVPTAVGPVSVIHHRTCIGCGLTACNIAFVALAKASFLHKHSPIPLLHISASFT
jgi:hypothetical protein